MKPSTTTILFAFLTSTTLAHPTDLNSSTSNHTLTARYTKHAWIGTYDNKGTTCQIAGPNRPQPEKTHCTKFRREVGQSMVIFWGAEMGERNHLSTFYDENCGDHAYAKNYVKDGKKIVMCDDSVAGDKAWGSARIWVD